MLIAIGPPGGSHEHWIITNDSTPQIAGSVTDFVSGGRADELIGVPTSVSGP